MTRDKENEKKSAKGNRVEPHGIPLGPAKQVEVTLPKDLTVVLSSQAFSQLFGFAEATELEVSLLGIVDRDGSTFTVSQFFLVPQKGAHSHTETDPAAIGELIERLMMEGRSDDAKKLRCWAHSHPGMDVFWSHTDDDNCARLCSDWLLSIVVSDGFRVRCRLDVASPVPATFDWIPVYCESSIEQSVMDTLRQEVRDKIKPMPLLGLGKNAAHKKEDKTMQQTQDTTDRQVELVEYCDMCGGWHPDGECPMELESSAYGLAHSERVAEAEDDVWF